MSFPSSVALRTPTHPSKPHSKAHTSMKPSRYRELQPPPQPLTKSRAYVTLMSHPFGQEHWELSWLVH